MPRFKKHFEHGAVVAGADRENRCVPFPLRIWKLLAVILDDEWVLFAVDLNVAEQPFETITVHGTGALIAHLVAGVLLWQVRLIPIVVDPRIAHDVHARVEADHVIGNHFTRLATIFLTAALACERVKFVGAHGAGFTFLSMWDFIAHWGFGVKRIFWDGL